MKFTVKFSVHAIYNKHTYSDVIKTNLIPFLPMDKSFTLSIHGVRFNAYRPRPAIRRTLPGVSSPKPETIAFLKQFARAFYPGNDSRTLNIVLN